MRLLEGLHLRVTDVDFERHEITVRGTGSGLASCITEPSGSEPFFIYFRASRKSITASPAAITIPATLAHIGTTIPLTVTSQPKDNLRICINAITAKMAAAMVVNGFIFSSFLR